LGKGIEITIIFYQDYTWDANKRPTIKFDSKGENIMEYKLGRIARIQGVHNTNCITKFI
jgi:hypothetical protein